MKAEDLLEWIEDAYSSTQELAKVLDFGIEMLFYLKEDSFDQKEVQQVVSALRGLAAGLRNQH